MAREKYARNFKVEEALKHRDTLKLVPGTPEENAPVFDFATERIIRPAA